MVGKVKDDVREWILGEQISGPSSLMHIEN
jgi:hypothetical protein